MLRSVILIFLLSYFSCVSGQTLENTIEWSAERKLEWSDFKKKRSGVSSGPQAMTNAGISIEFDCETDPPRVVVGCVFYKKGSWTRTEQSQALLDHEQLHFDITEIFARKLRMKLHELKDPCGKEASRIQGIYDRNFRDLQKYQNSYDRQTGHGIKQDEQAEWSNKVIRELNTLSQFSSDLY